MHTSILLRLSYLPAARFNTTSARQSGVNIEACSIAESIPRFRSSWVESWERCGNVRTASILSDGRTNLDALMTER
jgi:hypothetical protein